MSGANRSLVWSFGCVFAIVVLTAVAWLGLTRVAYADGLIIVDTAAVIEGSDGYCSLIEAIIAANMDSTYLDCTISGTPGADTIQLQPGATYILTAVYASVDGPNGLPSITSTINIEGQGATIVRAASAPDFRVFHIGPSGNLTLRDLTVDNGKTSTSGSWQDQAGGGIMVRYGAATVISTTFVDNSAYYGGGGIYCWSCSLVVSNTTFYNNQAVTGPGGGIAGGGTMTMTGSTLMDNSAIGEGGGIRLSETALIADTAILSNTCSGIGGGVWLRGGYYGATVLENVTIRGNTATDDGGGLYSAADTIIKRSTIDNNHSGDSGGGVYLSTYLGYGSLHLTNVTIYSNTADVSGGGVYINYPGSGNTPTAAITHTTIASNTAVSGAGGSLYNNQSTVSLASSIVAHGTAVSGGANCDGNPVPNITSGGYNLESGTDCSFTAGGDQQSADPLLGPLQDNGGDTHTMALLDGSPAITLVPPGTNGCGTVITTDQRGVIRSFSCSLGAYEYGPSHWVFLPAVMRSY